MASTSPCSSAFAPMCQKTSSDCQSVAKSLSMSEGDLTQTRGILRPPRRSTPPRAASLQWPQSAKRDRTAWSLGPSCGDTYKTVLRLPQSPGDPTFQRHRLDSEESDADSLGSVAGVSNLTLSYVQSFEDQPVKAKGLIAHESNSTKRNQDGDGDDRAALQAVQPVLLRSRSSSVSAASNSTDAGAPFQRRVIFPTFSRPIPDDGREKGVELSPPSSTLQKISIREKPVVPLDGRARSKSMDHGSIVGGDGKDPRKRRMKSLLAIPSPPLLQSEDNLPSHEDLLNGLISSKSADGTKLGRKPDSSRRASLDLAVPGSPCTHSPRPRRRRPTNELGTMKIPPFRGGQPGISDKPPLTLSKPSPRRRQRSSLRNPKTLPETLHFPDSALEGPPKPRGPPSDLSITKPLPSALRDGSPRYMASALPDIQIASSSAGDDRPTPSGLAHASPTLPIGPICAKENSGRRRGLSVDDTSSVDSPLVLPLRKVSSASSVALAEEMERKRATGGDLARAPSEGDEISVRAGMTRHTSLEEWREKAIAFDPRVWVVEYEQDPMVKWFSCAELDGFKREAIERIRRRHMKIIPSGTGRVILTGGRMGGSKKAMFSDPALGVGTEGDDDASPRKASLSSMHGKAKAVIPAVPSVLPPGEDRRKSQQRLISEIKNVLVVDPYGIFQKLFSKALHSIMGHVIITTASSSEEALKRIAAAKVVFPMTEDGATHGFDMIIIEERLQLFDGRRQNPQAAENHQTQHNTPSSGSALISMITNEQETLKSALHPPRYSLLIGVSAHFDQDEETLKESGADFVWAKPPPNFDESMRLQLLNATLRKRGKVLA